MFRVLIAHGPLLLDEQLQLFQALMLMLTGLSFATLFIFNLAPEGGGETWWKNLRPIHAILYFGAGVNSYYGEKEYASFLLFLDVYLGAASSLGHHEGGMRYRF